MYDIYDTYAGFENITVFRPQDGHRYIEAFEDDAGKISHFETGNLRDTEIQEWLNRKRRVKLRVLIARPTEKTKPDKRIYPFSLETLREVVAHFGIPKSFVNIAVSQTSITLDVGPKETMNSKNRPGILSVLGSHALAVTYDTVTGTIYALILKVCRHQAETLVNAIQSRAFELSLPMALPVIWLNVLGQTRARRVIGRKDGIGRSDVDTGIHWSKDGQIVKKKLRDLDFREITRRLTVLGSEAAWDAHAIAAQLDLASVCRRVQNTLIDLPNSAYEEEARMAFECRLRHAEQVLEGLKRWTVDTQQRTQVQLQTIYSLVSQRDNEINYASAVASQRIAEASQRDGALMKQIAEDSKEVSLQTWRDGVDMRIMAAVTLLTLPGTFTATLFSTSFFDFQSRGASTVVSPWVWLYFVVTLGLTTAFIAAWYSTSRAMTKHAPMAKSESSTNNIPLSPSLSSHGRDRTAHTRGGSQDDEVSDSPIETDGNDSEGLVFHNLSDAMAPEKFGNACAMCGVSIA